MTLDLYQRLRADLRVAMKSGDSVAVSVLRTAVAAIDNARAVEGESSVRLAGLSADVPRRELDDSALRLVLAAELEERNEAIRALHGNEDRQQRLRLEADLLSGYLVDRD